jgi:hypothetical protein
MRAALVLAVLAACSYAPLEATGTVDAPSVRNDAAGTCAAPASYGSPTMASQVAMFFQGSGQDSDDLQYLGKLNADDTLDVELIDGSPPFTDSIGAPETIPLSGSQLQYSTCSGCVLVFAKCTTCTLSAPTFNGTPYMATSGSLAISDVNPTIIGTVTNATFVEVTIDANGVTAPVPGGCTTSITSASFNVTVAQ